MFFKKLPLSFVLFFNIIGSGFFYAQTNFLPNQCPLGRPEHRSFICQCAPSPFKDTLLLKPYRGLDTMFCPWGRHNFICQCGPKPAYQLPKVVEKKKKTKRKK